MEHKTADIIQETRKLQIKRKEGGPDTLAEPIDRLSPQNLPQIKAEQEAQLKASRNVRLQILVARSCRQIIGYVYLL